MKHPMAHLCLFLILAGFVGACGEDSPAPPSTTTAPPPAVVPSPVPTLPPPPAGPTGNQPPVPNFRITPFPTTGQAPLVVNFNLCPTADPDGDHIIFFFDFGDGQTAQGPPCRQQNTYQRGRFTANMCVWDSRPENSLQCVAFPVDAR
jgi:hypothetical protein